MSKFEKRFKILLEADEVPEVLPDIPADDVTPDTDTIAAVDDVPANPAINYKKEVATQQIGQLEVWINKIDDFKTFLNGTEGESLQSIINSADCDTLLNDISRSETKKIARIAQDLSALVESLKGYLLSHEDE